MCSNGLNFVFFKSFWEEDQNGDLKVMFDEFFVNEILPKSFLA